MNVMIGSWKMPLANFSKHFSKPLFQNTFQTLFQNTFPNTFQNSRKNGCSLNKIDVLFSCYEKAKKIPKRQMKNHHDFRRSKKRTTKRNLPALSYIPYEENCYDKHMQSKDPPRRWSDYDFGSLGR